MPNRLGVFPGVPAVEIQVGLFSPVEFQLCAFSGRPTRLATIRKDTGEMQILLSCGRHG